MSDAPERIWCLEPQTSAQDQRRVGTWGNWDIGRGTEYRRADLPPTLAQAASVILIAMERAQIDMEVLRMFYNGQPRSALERLSQEDAALHRIGETK